MTRSTYKPNNAAAADQRRTAAGRDTKRHGFKHGTTRSHVIDNPNVRRAGAGIIWTTV